MPLTVDYYIAPQSPFVYLGHQRFVELIEEAGAAVRLLPMDLGGKIFPSSGGLPLPQRAPQRLAYRLVELKRFSEWLGLPMNIKPTFFPVAGDDAARLLIAVDRADGTEAALQADRRDRARGLGRATKYRRGRDLGRAVAFAGPAGCATGRVEVSRSAADL